ncbi:MAG: STAS domain-containing protein [Firmicutes bacterium]|nr:STAS domain-containing protein [Bacillota bacterium]
MLKMRLEYQEGILFVRLKGKLNKRTSYKINNYLVPVLKKHKIQYLVYNFYELEVIDIVGKEALLNSKCAILNNKGKILCCNESKIIKDNIKDLKIKKINNELDSLKLIGA